MSEKQQNVLLSNITEVKKDGVVHIVNFNLNPYEIRSDIFLKTINEKFALGKLLGNGAEGTVSEIGEDKVVKVSNDNIFTKESLISFMKEYCDNHTSEENLLGLYSEINSGNLVNDKDYDFNDILNIIKGSKVEEKKVEELLKSYFEEKLKKYIQKTNSIANSAEEMRGNSVFPSNFYVLTDKYGQFTIIEVSEEKEQDLRTTFNNEKEKKIDGLKIMNQVFDAVEIMHNSGIINRDIKPENIILKEGNAFLIDYGLAKSFDEKDDNKVGGTPFFRAPEFLSGDQNSKSDVYSLGITFFETVLNNHDIEDFFNKAIENIKFKRGANPLNEEYHFALHITEYINSGIINLESLVPEGVELGKDRESELKNRIVELLKKMLEADHCKRISATEAKKELRKIEKDFGLDKKEVKETNLREEIGEILEKNKEGEEKNGVLWKTGDKEEDLKKTLKNSAIKEYHLSENAKYCLESLQNCISEDGESVITLPNHEFYEKYDELKNGKNKKEYIMVMDKLIKLRELKLKKEIERFKKLKVQSLSKEAENFENLLDDVKLTTRVYKDEGVAKHLFVKDPKTNEFGELFNSYQNKEEDLRKFSERIVEIYDDLIFKEKNNNPELVEILINSYINLIFKEKNNNPKLIETFIDRIKYFGNDRKNIVNKVFEEAFANNRLDVMGKLLSDEDIKNKIYISNNLNYCNILVNNAITSNKIDMAKILIQNNFNNNFKRLNKNEEKIKLSMNEKSFINFKENLKDLANKQINDKKKLKKIIKNIDNIKPITKNNKKAKENSLEINKKKFESLKSVMKDLSLLTEESLQL